MQQIPTDWIGLADILLKLSQVSSTSVKKELLRLNESEDLKLIFRLCYDPYIKFNVTRVIISGTVDPHFDGLYNIDNLLNDLDKLVQREITGNAALLHVEQIYVNLPESFKPYLEKILQKDLKIGVATGLINSVWPDWIPEFKIGLCERFKKIKTSNIEYPVLVEPKIDGVRALAFIEGDFETKEIKVIIKARSGIPFENFKNIEKQILELAKEYPSIINHVLDGEIQDLEFQNTMTNARRVHNVQYDDANFYVWDIIPIDKFDNEEQTEPLSFRKTLLFNALAHDVKIVGYIPYLAIYKVDFVNTQTDFHNKKPNILLLPWKYANSFDEILSAYEQYISDGDEGIIVKRLNSSYIYSSGGKRGGQNAPWWKFKVQDYDALMGKNTGSEYTVQIVNYETGDKRTKYRDCLGAFYYIGKAYFEDQIIEVKGKIGGGFTDAQRIDFWKRREELMHKFVDVVAQQVSKNKYGEYSLRFPIFKGFREDLTQIDGN